MRGAAVCLIPKRHFCVFSVLVDGVLIIEPAEIEKLIVEFLPLQESDRETAKRSVPAELMVIPWETESYEVSLSAPEALEVQLQRMNSLIDAIDLEDPWIKRIFGVSGPGEGLVWYPVSLETENGGLPFDLYSKFVFKAKGSSHLVVKQKQPIQAKVEVASGVEAFLDMFVTEGRLEQGVGSQEIDGKFEKRFIPAFISWVAADVEKESRAELAASGLDWKVQVSKKVTERARKWYLEQIAKRQLIE